MLYTSGDLATYYAALDLPKSTIKQYITMIEDNVRDNGIEWTVSRCKDIYTDFVRFRAGLPPVGKWYKKNKLNLPSGLLSYIFQTALSSKRRRFSCSVLLRSYTRFIAKAPSQKQLTKFLSGVTSEDIDIPIDISKGVVMAATSVLGELAFSMPPSYMSYTPSPGKRVPMYDGTTAPEGLHWQSQWYTIGCTKTGRFLTEKYPRIFESVFSGFHRFVSGEIYPPSSVVDSVGKVGLIQEPGLKLRAVANPNRVYQVALKPLGDAIYDMLKQMPWDCTFDQSKAIPAIQQHLQHNKECHCVDLTGATDYFPLSLQLDVLKNIFPLNLDSVNLFHDISRSNWVFLDTTIKWTRGQPLGLYPSFGSFALTHGFLLYYLNGNCFNNKFFVLGDDVVILDDSLATKYLACLDALACPVSASKSLSSSLMAEFGGKLIFRDYLEPQLKWRQLSDDNFLDVVRLLGLRSLRLLRPQQRVVVKAIWDLPDFCGGLGFNPDGTPLKDRYEKYLSLFKERDSTYLTSYDIKFNQFFFREEVLLKDNRVLSQQWDSTKLPDLDQRSAALVLKYLPSFLRMYNIMGTNLFSVSPKGVLPIDGWVGKRKSLLALLQRKLGL